MKKIIFICTLLFTGLSYSQVKSPKLEPGIYAEFNTTKGKILCVLEHQKTPMTVGSFVGLAEGKLNILDTITYSTPFYDGLKFHRVINDFMIQGGDPEGTGGGGPKYRFYDEIHPDLKHTGPGILSMANAGPTTNGSQFFITHKETSWLDGKHTVFGHVISGQDIVNTITQGDVMSQVKIIRIGKEAQNWDASKAFMDTYAKFKAIDDEKKAKLQKIASMNTEDYKNYMFKEVMAKYPNAKLSPTGLVYYIQDEGNGPKPVQGNNLSVHYRGTFRADGRQFDASYDRGQPMDFTYIDQRMIPGFEEGLAMLGKGGKAVLVIPYFQAYGKDGRPGAIPPYSDLVFEIEIVDISQAKKVEEHIHHEGDGHHH